MGLNECEHNERPFSACESPVHCLKFLSNQLRIAEQNDFLFQPKEPVDNDIHYPPP